MTLSDLAPGVQWRSGSREGIETKVETPEVVLGGPAHVIEEIAVPGLIVVGRRGRSVVGGLLLGSVTLRLLHLAQRPVLAVPPE